jgi:CubicO group peptidase (beta-lactamase class C family)
VLGRIIERVSRQSYRRFLAENIFETLGMAGTGYDDHSSIMGHRAEGYANLRQRAHYIDMSLPYAAGGLYSTVEDLYRWNQALFGWEVVSRATWDAMLASAVTAPDAAPDQFGIYGLFVGPTGGKASNGHDGAINGFRSSLVHLTDENMDFVVLSNLERANTTLIVESLIGMFFDEG